MLKRVCSHKKSSTKFLLHVGSPLTNAKRSRSLTQIDHLGCVSSEAMQEELASSGHDSYDRLLMVPGTADESHPRTYKLPRKIPSQEFFSVAFDLLNEPGYEILPASRQVTLRDALQGLLERRGLDVNKIEIFLESSATPLSLQLETYRLGGSNLHVRAKELVVHQRGRFSRTNSVEGGLSSRSKSDQKKKSGSCKGRKSVENHATTSTNEDQPAESTWWRGRKKTSSAGGATVHVDKMEVLSDLLNQYSEDGIPVLPGLLTFLQPQQSDDPFYLEDHWSNFVVNWRDLPKRTQNQQDAIWELLETEVFFIRRLKIITDLFIACLCNLQCGCILNEIDTDKMFSNLGEVSAANQQFWMDHLMPMLKIARSSGQPLNPLHMHHGFSKFEQIFHPYIKYCSEHSICLQYVKEKHKHNDLFKTYVAWCETQKDCDRLRLTDLLVKPMQRLTKYSLLLKAIHKKTDNADTAKSLLDMNKNVEQFVCQVDAILRKIHEQQRLSSIIDRIESYQVVDCGHDELQKVLKDYNTFDLTYPMPGCGIHQSRELLLEGATIKLRDAYVNKMDVHCFLFTDMLLICKSQGKKGDKVRVIRQPYIVDRLVVQEMVGGGLMLVYLNEYTVATAAFALYTSDAKLWMDSIKKAQDQLQEARSSSANTDSRLFCYLGALQEEDEYYFPSMALMVARSSRCSLAHSRSGSVDMSETSAVLLPVSPIPTSPKSPLLSPKSPLQRCMSSGVLNPRKTAMVRSAPSSQGPSPLQSFDHDAFDLVSDLETIHLTCPSSLQSDCCRLSPTTDYGQVICKPVFRSEPNIKIQVTDAKEQQQHRIRRFLLARCSSDASAEN